MLRLLLAAAHLLALGIGLGSVWARARALDRAARAALTPTSLCPVFEADNWWGVAAVLWLVTGLWRALGGAEKAPSYYEHNTVFWAKMGLFAVLLLIESWPMVTLIRWRAALGRGTQPPGSARTAAIRSH